MRIAESAWNVAFFCGVGVPGPKRKATKQSPPNIATFFRKFASCPCSSGPWYAQKSCAASVAGMRKSARNRAARRSCHPMTSAMSRSPQSGGDQVRHDGWRPGDVEASNALLDRPITSGDALMLAQVLEPGLDDERFDVAPLVCWIVVDGPADGAIAAANRLQLPDGFHKGTRVGGIDSVFDLDADRSFVRGRDDVEVRLGPVRRRCEIEHGARA